MTAADQRPPGESGRTHDDAFPCEEGGQRIFHGNLCACPGCGNMVPVRMVGGLWTFVAHDQHGVPGAVR